MTLRCPTFSFLFAVVVALFLANFSVVRLKDVSTKDINQLGVELETGRYASQYLNPSKLKRGIVLFTHSSPFYAHQAAIKLANQGYYVLLPRASPNNPHNFVHNTASENATGDVSTDKALTAEERERKRNEYHQYSYSESDNGADLLEKQLVRGIERIDALDFSSPSQMNELYIHLFQLQHKLDAPVKAIVFSGPDFVHEALVQAEALTPRGKARARQMPGPRGRRHSRQFGSKYLLDGCLVDTAANYSGREQLHVLGAKAFNKFLEGVQEAIVPTLDRGLVPLLVLVDNPLLPSTHQSPEDWEIAPWAESLHEMDGGLLDGYRSALGAMRDVTSHLERKFFRALRHVQNSKVGDAPEAGVNNRPDGREGREQREAARDALVQLYKTLAADHSPMYRVAVVQERAIVPTPNSGNDSGSDEDEDADILDQVEKFLSQHFEGQREFACNQLDYIVDLGGPIAGQKPVRNGSSGEQEVESTVEWVFELDEQGQVMQESAEGHAGVEAISDAESALGVAKEAEVASLLPLYGNDVLAYVGTRRGEIPLTLETADIVVRINAPPDYVPPVIAQQWELTLDSDQDDSMELIPLWQWAAEQAVTAIRLSPHAPMVLKDLVSSFPVPHAATATAGTVLGTHTREDAEKWYTTLLPLYQIGSLCVRNSYDLEIALEREYISQQSGGGPRHKSRRRLRKGSRRPPPASGMKRKRGSRTKRDNYQSKKSYNPYN